LGVSSPFLAFRRRTDCLTGPVKVSDGGTIVVEQLARLHGIHAPELNQTFWWRDQQMACGTMSWPPWRRS
jgi:endonuclease YncB( thermonuclease family)